MNIPGGLPEAYVNEAAALGLNVFGAMSAARYDAMAPEGLKTKDLAPGAGSLLLAGSGGRRYWEAFMAANTAEPARFLPLEHPFESWLMASAKTLNHHLMDLGVMWWTTSGMFQRPLLPFQSLCEEAGMVTKSRLGPMLNPEYGPWTGLRLAIFLRAALEDTHPIGSLCDGCDAPCLDACHGDAIKEVGAFDWQACNATRERHPACKHRCDSRLVCPVGQGHRQPPEAIRYHATGDRDYLRSLFQ